MISAADSSANTNPHANVATRFRPAHALALAVAAALHSAFVVSTWSLGYIDFGDGNYLYIGSRIAEGAVVYRDILAPQPPCHLFLGAALAKLAGLLGLATPLFLARAVSLAIHITTGLLVADLARRAWGSAASGVAAGAIFWLLPIDTWWSMAWQSEPLEVLFLVMMIRLAIAEPRPGRDIMTGICGALAALTNATAAPFLLVMIVFMAVRDPRRAARVAVPALVLAGTVTAALEIWTGGAFLNNVVLNQVGTYPRGRFWAYAVGEFIERGGERFWRSGKIIREGRDILYLEGGYIFFALFGFARLLRESPLARTARDGLAWFCLATLCSFVYVSKGGTMDYIFCLAGPAVALLAAGELIALARSLGLRQVSAVQRGDETNPSSAQPEVSSRALRGIGIALRLCGLAIFFSIVLGPTARHYRRLSSQAAFELPDLAHAGRDAEGIERPNVERVLQWIERNSEPGDTILAPPFYAFLSGRRLWSDYSELFIWRIKDLNDRLDENPAGEGWTKTRALADAIRNRELPIVIIELGQQGQLPEITDALAASYRPLIAKPYRTLNTQLGVYVPAED